MLVLGGDWSAYWYNGDIYGSEIARGLDVFELTPTKLLTKNEIEAAKSVRLTEENVQDQQKIEWPSTLVVAKAYVDQLERSQALAADEIEKLRSAIHGAESSHLSKKSLDKLKGFTPTLEQDGTQAKNAADAKRMQALAEILKHPAA